MFRPKKRRVEVDFPRDPRFLAPTQPQPVNTFLEVKSSRKPGNTPGDADNVYITMFVYNPTDQFQALVYGQNSSIGPIVEKIENKYLAVARFSIPLDALPIQFNKGNAYYSVTVESSTGSTQIFVNIGNQDTSGQTNAIYSYQQLTKYINSALAQAHDAEAPAGQKGNYPMLNFDAANGGLFTLWMPVAYLTQVSAPSPPAAGFYNLYMNSNMFTGLFNNFDSWYYADPAHASLGEDYLIVANKQPQNYYAYNAATSTQAVPQSPPVTGVNPQNSDYVAIVQEYVTLYLWDDLQSVVLKSRNLPVNPETFTVPSIGIQNSNYPTEQVLASFQPVANNPGSAQGLRSVLTFVPSPEYRLIDLIGTGDLDSITIEAWCAFKGNPNLQQLYLTPKQAAQIELVFKDKSLAKVVA